MERFKMLSGEQLVALGWKKTNCSLPELGLKDVVSNGSWLEQKHVQNALEARKDIVEVERIEKCGTLSHAEWNDNLSLAEVTKVVGGHWQYIGHNVGRTLYIHPEEALLLMEINCLHLTYNGVTVSIQQAYSLLLKDKQELIQYRVYASLSRLGFKIFRHTFKSNDDDENIEDVNKVEDLSSDQINEVSNTAEEQVESTINQEIENSAGEKDANEDCETNNISNALNANITNDTTVENDEKDKLEEPFEMKNRDSKADLQSIVSETDMIEHSTQPNSTVHDNDCDTKYIDNVQMETKNTAETVEVSSSINLCDDENTEMNESFVEVNNGISSTGSVAIIQHKIDNLSCRENKPRNSRLIYECFDQNLPDFYHKNIVTVKAPEEQYIPRNVFLTKTAYVLNLMHLKLKSVTFTPSSSTHTYGASDEANAQHVRRIRSGDSDSPQSHFTPQFFPNMRFPHQQQYRQYNYWNQYNYNWAYQRPFFVPFRFQAFSRMQHMFRCFPNPTTSASTEISNPPRTTRKRKRNNPRKYHLESIKKLAAKLKALVASGNRQEENIDALHRLVNTYNVRYETRLQLSDQLDILDNEIVLETINLDDDGQSSSKKKKKEDMHSYDENFNSIKQFSARLKELEAKNLLTGRHRRAFSNVIRTFNKSYSANIQLDSNLDVIDKNRIVIASSSDSDCTIEEIQSSVEQTSSKRRRSTKLRNPFYIMKQLSEKPANVSRDVTNECSQSGSKKKFEYSHHLKSMFSKYWLPSEDDFGRAEVPLKNYMNHHTDHHEDFVYQFIRSKPFKFKNWLDAKIAYWLSCKETAMKYELQNQNTTKIKLDSIINPEDCTNLRLVLKKLSIIKTRKDVLDECSLRVHYDVYHRDVPNFKKTKKPKPHFRVICIEETSEFLTGNDFATLHSKYSDEVAIIFAIVGSSSISYLQMNPMGLPIYIPNSNIP